MDGGWKPPVRFHQGTGGILPPCSDRLNLDCAEDQRTELRLGAIQPGIRLQAYAAVIPSLSRDLGPGNRPAVVVKRRCFDSGAVRLRST